VFVIPDDPTKADKEVRDQIEPPIAVSALPRGGDSSEGISLELTVGGDGEEPGSDTATGDETATVEHEP
jgi:hypothetical protein